MNTFFRITVSILFLFVSSAFADIEMVSVTSTGEQGNGLSESPAVSSNGRYVVFESKAFNLVGDVRFSSGILVRDRETGITKRIDIDSEIPRGSRNFLSISDNGRFVVFSVDPEYIYFAQYIYLHDLETEMTERIDITTSGEPATRWSIQPSVSADGRYVAFSSSAPDLVEGDTNGTTNVDTNIGDDIFVRDRNTGITERVSVSSSGMQSDHISKSPSISADGRFVAFESRATNLVMGDTNGVNDVFIHDRNTKITERLSVSSSQEQANNISFDPSISADGRYVAFVSRANNLVEGDTNEINDAFVHDRVTGITERVNVSSNGEQADYDLQYSTYYSLSPSISADGRYVAFESPATNLVPNDTNKSHDVFVRDRQTNVTKRASVSKNGAQGTLSSQAPSISSDGRHVGFSSFAKNLVTNDINDTKDVFLADNPFVNPNQFLITVEKLINNTIRDAQGTAAKLSTGTQYRQSYRVTNNSPNRIYSVQVFDDGELVCNMYAIDPGQSKQRWRCNNNRTVLEGDQHTMAKVTAKVSGSGEVLTSYTDAYYTGLTNVTGKLRVTHRINKINADTVDQAPTLDSSQAQIFFKVENTGEIELYQVNTYHDPVSPVNDGWDLQCFIGSLKPGQIRYCKRDITLGESGLNQAMGRVQGRNAITSATNVVNASNPTYFIVP